nr:NADH dehydrogenase subunit 2 [Hypoaspis sp. 3 JO-2023a]
MSWINMISWFFLFLSICFCFSSSNWFFLWISLELNLLCFIFNSFKKNNISANSMFKYFIIQSMSSLIFLFSMILLKNIEFFELNFFFISMAMYMKLGFPPFHFWLTDVGEGLDWLNFFIFNTIQKIIPLYIISFSMFFTNQMIILGAFLGSLMMFNQNSLRKILIFSGITHMAWMLFIMKNNNTNWMLYLTIYSFSFYMFIYFNMKLNMSSSLQLMFFPSLFMNLLMILSFLNISGLPPFLGFFPKWLTMSYFNFNMSMSMTALILSSLLSCFIYINTILPIMTNKITLKKKIIKNFNPFIILSTMFLFLLIPLIY